MDTQSDHTDPFVSFGTRVSYWYWTSVSSKKKKIILFWTTKQIRLKVKPMRKEIFYTIKKRVLGKGPYKVPPPWIKYLKLQLVNSNFTLHFHLTELNVKWSSPMTLTVALRWNSLNQVTVVWPQTTKPTKCLLVLNSEINADYFCHRLFYKVSSLASTARPTKCSNGKTIIFVKFTFQVIK